ncbi:hypothetical protein [Chelativorans sp. AA-79]|uniref:hypothetical protein n=1 Tax=Chelativorans sp. AA-79 TaxID=3028735 RepID=UPI0023F66858|nr:hypothetical protein [Chelativorans sp. AA-79]WEX09023.1 hypothetical protein PVE73_23745 [Chelativorans sp. AA-79]
MPRKKTERKPQTEKAKAGGGIHIHWVWVALIAGLVFGAASGYFVGLQASAGTSGYTDVYGRSPGHPHYRHNHP